MQSELNLAGSWFPKRNLPPVHRRFPCLGMLDKAEGVVEQDPSIIVYVPSVNHPSGLLPFMCDISLW